MALIVITSRPRALLRKIREAIFEGVVTTWKYDSDGDFTHTSEQWGSRLWLRPQAAEEELRLRTVPRHGERISTVGYAYYHGHFTRMLLAHFDEDFEEVIATARPDHGDRVGK